ncbi:flagellar type III secretion system protein FliR [candidate division KSB1 bacterium]|nr:flagellar type III secretion system protein FliR [candidate division KSB1 bacterium]
MSFDQLINQFYLFAMVFVRITTMMVVLPIFGSRLTPLQLKIALGGLLSFLIVPLLPSHHIPESLNLFILFYHITREVLVGLVIGFATTLVFMAFQFAGTIVGMQMGFGIVNVVDPQSNIQVSIIGQFLYIIAILVFLSLDGHLFLIKALVHSFQVIPLNQAVFTGKLVQKIISMTAEVFVIAIKIGIPAIAALLLTSVALGVIARTVPQMNVFIVGFPLNIGLGLFTLATSLPIVIYLFRKLLIVFEHDIITIIKLMPG